MDLAFDDWKSPPFQAPEAAWKDHDSPSEERHAPEDGEKYPGRGGALVSPFASPEIDPATGGNVMIHPSTCGYVALIHPPEDGPEWGVTFPDVPGCVTGGETFEDAVAAAREALSGHLAALRADCDPLPEARSMAHFLEGRTAGDDGGLPHLVFPRHIPAERVRVNITIDKAMLRQADEAAEARGLTRSALIESALASVIDG